VRRAYTFYLLAFTLGSGGPAIAGEIYKCLDASGRSLYTSEKRDTAGKKCKVVAREVSVVPPQAPAKPAAQSRGSSAYPREDAAARAAAKQRQRQVLESELATEEELLGKARTALAEQEAVRHGDEKNYARVLERLKPYRDDVEIHEKNVAALKRELQNLNR
jgi:hypothetical protein